jgi:hypothetical protein
VDISSKHRQFDSLKLSGYIEALSNFLKGRDLAPLLTLTLPVVKSKRFDHYRKLENS